MIITREIYAPVIAEYTEYIGKGVIPEKAVQQLDKSSRIVADKVGMDENQEVHPYTLFVYCEHESIESEEVVKLLEAVKNVVATAKGNWDYCFLLYVKSSVETYKKQLTGFHIPWNRDIINMLREKDNIFLRRYYPFCD